MMHRARKTTVSVVLSVALAAFSLLAGPSATAAPNSTQLAYVPWQNYKSKHCLDQSWAGGVEGHTVLVYKCSGATNQQWALSYQGDGTYHVINQRSGNCLHQAYNADGTASTIVQAWTCSTVRNQNWIITNFTDGTVKFTNSRSGWVLDQDYSGGLEHQNALAYRFNGGDNQYWF